MRIGRAYLAGRKAYWKGLGSDPPAHQDEEWRREFRKGWQDARREQSETAGRPRVLHR